MKLQNLTISSKDKIIFLSNLHTMLSSGISIIETVDSLLEDSKGNMKKLLVTLREDLFQGQHVATSFAKFPRIFDKVTVNIIKASEEAGRLENALNDIKENIKKEVEFENKIKGALIYPVFIVGVFFAVFIMILVVVVPKISAVFGNLNVVLPVPTKIMIFLSNALLTYTIPIIIVFLVFVAGLRYFFIKNRLIFIRALISFPVISHLAEQIDLTKFTRSLHLLLSAGIPITTALVIISFPKKQHLSHA